MKRIYTILFLALSINVFAQVPTNGLLGYWAFNGNANDASGNNLNGIVTGATLTTDRFGNANSAYYFDGASFITVPHVSMLNSFPITLCAWVKGTSQFGGFITKYYGSSNNGYAIHFNDGHISSYYFGNSLINLDGKNLDVINDDIWHFVVASYDTSGVKLYKDNILIYEEAWSGGTPSVCSTTTNLFMGKFNQPSGPLYFTGNLDDIRIYNRALTSSEISALYNELPPNSLYAGLVAYYPFNGNAIDASGNGNNGIVRGASLTTDRFGQPSSAYQFVGNDNNTVSYIVADSKNLPSGKTPRTISAWVTNDSYGIPGGSGNDGHPIISYGTPATNSDNELMFFTTSSGVAKVRYAGFNNDLDLPFTYKLNTWYNVVSTYDGTTAKIYVNDTLIGSGAFSTWNTLLDSIVIGSQTTRTRFHNGKIDDLKIYNRVLNNTEIAMLYNDGICKQTVYDTVHVTVNDTIYVTETAYISVTDTLVINATLTGIAAPNNTNTLKIYPNPANDHITIDYGNYANMSGYTLKITNSLGATVFTTTINQPTSYVDLNGWSGNGIYFVHLIDAQSNSLDIRKIIIH